MPVPPDFYDDLPLTLAHAWAMLARGVADRRSAFHTPAVATNGLDGAPRVRTVVLRAVDAATRTLRFHTDARAPKAAEIARDARVALHVYDPGAKLQVRIEGVAALHAGDDVAARAWAASRPMSRACYGAQPAPGSPISAGGAFAVPRSEAATAAGEANFVAVAVRVTALETLYLAHEGHRRARFSWHGDACEACWLAP